MARKKHRNIVVDGVKYGWSHSLPVRWADSYEIRIWKNKRIIHREKVDEWNGESIKPSDVSEIIKQKING